MSASAKKILVIRFSSIGDIVLTSPVLRCLKSQINAEVHFLTKAKFASIVKPNPNVDKVFEIRKNVKEVLKSLKAERYDYIIDLHKNLRSFHVKLSLGVSTSSFHKLNYEKWLLTNFKIQKLPGIHIVDRYLKTTNFLEVENDGKGLDYFIPSGEEVDLSNFYLQKTPFIVFSIGGAHATKRLPVQKLIAICSGLEAPVVLLGGKDDLETGEAITSEVKGNHIINFCGKFSIHQSASVIKQSTLVLTHDTGMMHIAAAFKKRIISIWGNTVPAFGMYPYYPEGVDRNTSFEVPDLKCRPCSKIGFNSCPKKHFKCMQDQDVERLVAQANDVFKA